MLCFNVTTPLKAWNAGDVQVLQLLTDVLQCDHAVEGVEWPDWAPAPDTGTGLQCDHAVEGVECPRARVRDEDDDDASM